MVKLIRQVTMSFSLVETLISLIIILVISTIMTSIIIQSHLSSFSWTKIRAEFVLLECADELSVNEEFISHEKWVNNLIVKQEVVNEQFDTHLYTVKISVFDEQRVLITSRNFKFYH